MHNHSYENEFTLHVNEISNSHMKGYAPRLALRKRLKVIRKWPIELQGDPIDRFHCHAIKKINRKLSSGKS